MQANSYHWQVFPNGWTIKQKITVQISISQWNYWAWCRTDFQRRQWFICFFISRYFFDFVLQSIYFLYTDKLITSSSLTFFYFIHWLCSKSRRLSSCSNMNSYWLLLKYKVKYIESNRDHDYLLVKVVYLTVMMSSERNETWNEFFSAKPKNINRSWKESFENIFSYSVE